MLVMMLTLFSCDDKLGEINIDPTRSSDVNPENQLVYAQLWFSGELETQERTSTFYLLSMMQQLAGPWYMRLGGAYIHEALPMAVLWERSYPYSILNIVDAVERTNDLPDRTNLNAMCRIVKVYSFARLTDIYGDIPYFDAGKGHILGISRPKYDSQEEIYDDFLKELKEASEQLDAGKDQVATEIFYGGNISSWKKFANSLRLRLAMRLVKVDPERARTEAEEAFNAQGGVFTSNDDICMTRHMDVQNTYADLRGNSMSAAINQQTASAKVNTTLLETLRSTSDPRLDPMVRCYRENVPLRIFEREDITAQVRATMTGGNLVGVNPGRMTYEDWQNARNIILASGATYSAQNADIKAELNNFFFRNNAPFFHLTYAEVELLLADAAVRLGTNLGGSASEHYERGVTAAIRQLSLFPGGPAISDAVIQSFLANNALQAGNELNQINTQLWIALLLNGPETFANWRRSGYPALAATPRATNPVSTSQTIPRRFEYPLTEREQNTESFRGAVDRMGGTDSWNNRVWWDKE